MNTKETMSAYLDEVFNEQKLTAELKNPDSHFNFAQIEDKTAGYLKMNYALSQSDINDPESLEIERIYVDKDFKRQGLSPGKPMTSEWVMNCSII